jgi:hypothetical protein
MWHRYTEKQIEFLKENVKGRSNLELTELFNTHFELNLGINQIRAFKKNRRLSSGLDGRFKPGNVPVNKGIKGGGWEPTQFKKGQKPHNYKPIGTERVNGEGYVDIKVADPNKWRAKHVLVWEKENGPIPKGHVIIFGDRNRRNYGLDNLILVSRKQLALLNRNNLIQNDAELTRTGIIVADIYSKIGERKKT